MSQVDRTAGLVSGSLYQALSAQVNPEFVTILKVITPLELKQQGSCTCIKAGHSQEGLVFPRIALPLGLVAEDDSNLDAQ